MNLAQYCLQNAKPDPQSVALEVIGPNGRELERWTYEELTAAVLAVSRGFITSDLKRGERVLLRIGHSSDFPLVFFGAIAAGLVPIPTSAMLTGDECNVILADSGAAAVVHDGHTAMPETDGDKLLLGPDAIEVFKRGEQADFADTLENDPAFIVYTSGTSGTPKGVLHAQRAALGRKPMYQGWYGLGREDRLLHAGAFNWTYTLGVGLMDPWANGATSIVYDGPRDPDVWPGLIAASKATLFAAVPSLYRRILKYGDVGRDTFPRLRHGLTAGEALPASLYRTWRTQTGKPLFEALGMSEISTYISSGPDVPVKEGSPGKPQSGRRIAVLQEDIDEPVEAPVGETGLLAVHADEPGLMLGYWERPEETRTAFRGDWFLTGDRARFDEDGYVWYDGRSDDLMNAFGYRVAPEEVERILSSHADVQEVAVTDVPMGNGVSLMTAFVVPRDNKDWNPGNLAEHAAHSLAEYKRPKVYRAVDALPRTASGKVQRKVLRASAERDTP